LKISAINSEVVGDMLMLFQLGRTNIRFRRLVQTRRQSTLCFVLLCHVQPNSCQWHILARGRKACKLLVWSITDLEQNMQRRNWEILGRGLQIVCVYLNIALSKRRYLEWHHTRKSNACSI